MKTEHKQMLTLWAVIFFSFAVFFGGAYGYLKIKMPPEEQPAEHKSENIPYDNTLPQNANLLFILPDRKQVMICLLFSEGRLNVVFADEAPRELYCGAAPDYTFHTKEEFLEKLIDRFGGLTLTLDGTTARYTGIQIIDFFSKGRQEPTLNAVVTALLHRIAEVGFTRQDLVFFIEQTKTDLTVPDCYDWSERIPELCANPQFFRCADSEES